MRKIMIFPGFTSIQEKPVPDLMRKSGPTTLVANLQLNGIREFGSESVHSLTIPGLTDNMDPSQHHRGTEVPC